MKFHSLITLMKQNMSNSTRFGNQILYPKDMNSLYHNTLVLLIF